MNRYLLHLSERYLRVLVSESNPDKWSPRPLCNVSSSLIDHPSLLFLSLCLPLLLSFPSAPSPLHKATRPFPSASICYLVSSFVNLLHYSIKCMNFPFFCLSLFSIRCRRIIWRALLIFLFVWYFFISWKARWKLLTKLGN